MVISGIYQIRNKVNGKCYVGRSVNIKGRWKKHKSLLKNEKHHSIVLQRAWNKYGEDNFEFLVVEECEPNEEVQILREQFYKDKLDSSYSIGECSSGGDNISNHPEYDKIVENIGNGYRKYLDNLTNEERRKRFAKYGKDNPNYGNKWSSDQRDKLSKYWKRQYKNGYQNPWKGREMPESQRLKISEFAKTRTGEKNSFYGKTHTKEVRELLSKKMKDNGSKYNVQKKKIYVNGQVYESLSESARQLDIPAVTIRWRAYSKNPKFKEYYYLD